MTFLATKKLLVKMQTYKTTGGLVEILEIYLTDGKQRAKIGNWNSSDLHVKTGMLQSPCRIFSHAVCKIGGGVDWGIFNRFHSKLSQRFGG